MYLTKEQKEVIFETYGKNKKNSGLSESQIALFTERINHLTDHLKVNKHDYVTQRSLQKLVGQRRSLLDYLKNNDISRYRNVVKELDLRK